jgi:hypothetical protein
MGHSESQGKENPSFCLQSSSLIQMTSILPFLLHSTKHP